MGEMKISDFEFKEKRESSIISGERDLVDSFTSDNGVLKIKGFKYSYSPKDDYFFINPQPQLESLTDYYNGHGKPLTQEQLDNSLNEYNKKGRPFEMAEHCSTYLRKLGKFSGNYLDFGCGGGTAALSQQNRL